MTRPAWMGQALIVAISAGAAILAAGRTARCNPVPLGPDPVRVVAGFFVFTSAEGAVILVEALIFYLALDLGWRALWTSLVANAASAIAGFLVLPSRTVIAVPLGFLLVLVVELPIIVLMNLGYANRARLLKVGAITNVITYSAVTWLMFTLRTTDWS